jgi:hypothetical protein
MLPHGSICTLIHGLCLPEQCNKGRPHQGKLPSLLTSVAPLSLFRRFQRRKSTNMAWSKRVLTVLAALFVQDVAAQFGSAKGSDFLRFGCSQLVIERADPIVNPGTLYTPHVHQIVGGNSFNITVRDHQERRESQRSLIGKNRWTQ